MDLFDYTAVRDTYEAMNRMSPEERGHFATVFTMWSIAHIVYYIMAGTAVIVLGRRLIQASFAAFKEARRERA